MLFVQQFVSPQKCQPPACVVVCDVGPPVVTADIMGLAMPLPHTNYKHIIIAGASWLAHRSVTAGDPKRVPIAAASSVRLDSMRRADRIPRTSDGVGAGAGHAVLWARLSVHAMQTRLSAQRTARRLIAPGGCGPHGARAWGRAGVAVGELCAACVAWPRALRHHAPRTHTHARRVAR